MTVAWTAALDETVKWFLANYENARTGLNDRPTGH